MKNNLNANRSRKKNELNETQTMILCVAKKNGVKVSPLRRSSNKVIYISEGNKIYSINRNGVKRRSYKKEKELKIQAKFN